MPVREDPELFTVKGIELLDYAQPFNSDVPRIIIVEKVTEESKSARLLVRFLKENLLAA